MSGGNWKDLYKAARDGDSAKARYHLDLGVDPNFQHPEYFSAPLFEAIRGGHIEIVKLLLEKGNVNPAMIEECSDDSALDIALACKQFDILHYLNTKLPKEKQILSRHILVTGVGLGNGKDVCKELLLKGHRIVFTCGCEDAAMSLKKELWIETGNSRIDYIVGSLDTVRNVRSIISQTQQMMPLLNTLIHNANIWSTKKSLNQDGLELSFMINYMAKDMLSKELMPMLNKNESPRIVYVLPDFSSAHKPDLNATPFGKNFHWTRTFSETISCCLMSYYQCLAQTAAADDNISVAVSVIQSKGNYSIDVSKKSSSGCTACILGIMSQYFGDSSSASDLPVWLERTEGKTDQSSFLDSNVDEITLTQWEQWTADFLARSGTPR